MAGNHNSGRRKSNHSIDTIIGMIAPDAIGRIKELSKDMDVPASVRLEANKYLVDRYLGKPHQSSDITAEITNVPVGEIVYHLDTGDNGKGNHVPEQGPTEADNQAESPKVEAEPCNA